MKKLFLLSFFVSLLFIPLTSAQWWVQGGNLLWPYGTVTVKDSFSVGGNSSFSSNVSVDNNLTVSGTINGIKYYRALIRQESDNDPIALIMENSIGDIVWSRLSAGRYVATFNNFSLPEASKLFIIAPTYSNTNNTMYPILTNITTMDITFRQDNGDLDTWGSAVIDYSSIRYYPVTFILYP